MKLNSKQYLTVLAILACVATASAQNRRDQQVLEDREQFADSESWYYDDLETGMAIAKSEDRPVLVVFR